MDYLQGAPGRCYAWFILKRRWAEQFYGNLSTLKKALTWLDSAGKTDFYDNPELVAASARRYLSEAFSRDAG